MSTVTNDSDALMIATFNFTKKQLAWLTEEAIRRANMRPGSKPNRSEVAREAIEKAMIESEQKKAS